MQNHCQEYFDCATMTYWSEMEIDNASYEFWALQQLECPLLIHQRTQVTASSKENPDFNNQSNVSVMVWCNSRKPAAVREVAGLD